MQEHKLNITDNSYDAKIKVDNNLFFKFFYATKIVEKVQSKK